MLHHTICMIVFYLMLHITLYYVLPCDIHERQLRGVQIVHQELDVHAPLTALRHLQGEV